MQGKLRDTLAVPLDAPQADLERLALASEKIKRAVGDQKVLKVIVVPNRIVNIVLGKSQ